MSKYGYEHPASIVCFLICDTNSHVYLVFSYCIMQLIKLPEGNLHLYYKKSKLGSDKDKDAEERLEEKGNVDDAIKEFVRMFEEITGNEFEPWEREKKIEKKRMSFFPVDMVHHIFLVSLCLLHAQPGFKIDIAIF